MSNQDRHIDYEEIAAYLAGEGSLQERKRVENWVQSSEENRLFFEKCERIFSMDFSQVYATGTQPQFDTSRAWSNVYSALDLSDTAPDQTELTLDTAIEEEGDDVIHMELEKETIRSYPWIRIAAVFVIGLSAVFLLLNRSANKVVTLAANETVQEFYLADSTRIVLETGSSLSHRNNYGKSNRDVDLSGKAYFDVARNEDLPFIISTKSGRIEVLGTAFVVEENNDSLYVIVERGKVQLSSISSGDYLVLEKNEKGLLDLDSFEMEKSVLENTNDLYWANKRLTYRQQSLESVFDELAELFDREVEYDPTKLENCRITAVFMEQSFEEILENMAISMEFEYSIDNNRVVITSNGCETD